MDKKVGKKHYFYVFRNVVRRNLNAQKTKNFRITQTDLFSNRFDDLKKIQFKLQLSIIMYPLLRLTFI